MHSTASSLAQHVLGETCRSRRRMISLSDTTIFASSTATCLQTPVIRTTDTQRELQTRHDIGNHGCVTFVSHSLFLSRLSCGLLLSLETASLDKWISYSRFADRSCVILTGATDRSWHQRILKMLSHVRLRLIHYICKWLMRLEIFVVVNIIINFLIEESITISYIFLSNSRKMFEIDFMNYQILHCIYNSMLVHIYICYIICCYYITVKT